jgi:hypothetical protein
VGSVAVTFVKVDLIKLSWDGWKPIWLSCSGCRKSPLSSKRAPHVMRTSLSSSSSQIYSMLTEGRRPPEMRPPQVVGRRRWARRRSPAAGVAPAAGAQRGDRGICPRPPQQDSPTPPQRLAIPPCPNPHRRWRRLTIPLRRRRLAIPLRRRRFAIPLPQSSLEPQPRHGARLWPPAARFARKGKGLFPLGAGRPFLVLGGVYSEEGLWLGFWFLEKATAAGSQTKGTLSLGDDSSQHILPPVW